MYYNKTEMFNFAYKCSLFLGKLFLHTIQKEKMICHISKTRNFSFFRIIILRAKKYYTFYHFAEQSCQIKKH